MRHLLLASALLFAASNVPLAAEDAAPAPVTKEALTKESKEHPRIHESMKNLERTIKELEAAPDDFGGHKAEALAACKAAYRQLRLALGYRVEAEAEKHDK